MKDRTYFPALILSEQDNVATAIEPIATGERATAQLTAAEAIPFGFKIALHDVDVGAPVVKYGVPIAKATCFIPKGCCVHIHNAASLCDLRSSDFDSETAAPTDMRYMLPEDCKR